MDSLEADLETLVAREAAKLLRQKRTNVISNLVARETTYA